MDNEIYEKTKQLLRQLNHFLLHVIVYFFVNMFIVVTAFTDISNRWWLFFIVIVWAFALIYHCLRVYGVDILSRKNKKMNLLWSLVLRAVSG
ncbi:MAG TPA: 2TM domain-containing protein [Fulvivirga sp.]|nr:2TM domain-containing protein [Fulvivirga sp.]